MSKKAVAQTAEAGAQAAGSPFGYRIVALVAAICCIFGGLIMKVFNEKKILDIINSDTK